jgi:hypothetical protein
MMKRAALMPWRSRRTEPRMTGNRRPIVSSLR